jgi:hypothetical protein
MTSSAQCQPGTCHHASICTCTAETGVDSRPCWRDPPTFKTQAAEHAVTNTSVLSLTPCPCHAMQQSLSTDDGGCSRSSPASKTKYQFRIFFPMPPYDGLQFNALRSGTGFNFTVSYACRIVIQNMCAWLTGLEHANTQGACVPVVLPVLRCKYCPHLQLGRCRNNIQCSYPARSACPAGISRILQRQHTAGNTCNWHALCSTDASSLQLLAGWAINC